MSFITGLTRMWLTRTAKPFTFKMDMTRYCRMQNVKTLGCMFISLFARVSATFALIAKCGILLNCVIGT